MQTVNVDLGERSYKVFIGSNILGNQHEAFDIADKSTALIVRTILWRQSIWMR